MFTDTPTFVQVFMSRYFYMVGGAGLFFIFSCGPAGENQGYSERKREIIDTVAVQTKANALIQKAGGVLLPVLMRTIEQKGVAGALEFCSSYASQVLDSISEVEKIRIARVSHKARNAMNSASFEEMEIIAHMQEEKRKGKSPETVIVDKGEKMIFYSPIVINAPLCLQCHGNPQRDIAPEVLSKIQQLYPKDLATGFAMGEIRGMWKVELSRQEGEGKQHLN